MLDKFSIEELMIKIMPGGFLLAACLYLFPDTQFVLSDKLDFFYTFIFFCSAFVVGEILQTIAHGLEWIIDIFFKFRRPSEVFLYKDNPVIKNSKTRLDILSLIKPEKNDCKSFDKNYQKISFFKFWNRNKEDDELMQHIFLKLYSKVRATEETKTSNRTYLFVRVMMVIFLILSITSFIQNSHLTVIFFILFCVFLWRARGCAKGLVLNVVLSNLTK